MTDLTNISNEGLVVHVLGSGEWWDKFRAELLRRLDAPRQITHLDGAREYLLEFIDFYRAHKGETTEDTVDAFLDPYAGVSDKELLNRHGWGAGQGHDRDLELEAEILRRMGVGR